MHEETLIELSKGVLLRVCVPKSEKTLDKAEGYDSDDSITSIIASHGLKPTRESILEVGLVSTHPLDGT